MSYQGGGGGGRNRGGGGNYRGGGGGARGGRSSRGGGRGGGARGRSGPEGGGGGRGEHGLLSLCRDFTATGQCPRGPECYFSHVVQLHATVIAAPKPTFGANPNSDNNRNNYNSNNYNNNNYNNNNNRATVSSVAIWEQPNPQQPFKIFTSSHDGYWRLWNTAGGQFTAPEFESNMNGRVNQCVVTNHFLFCGFEAVCRAVPSVPVGMVHAWNLQHPAQPPLELHVQPATAAAPAAATGGGPALPPTAAPSSLVPYAHNTAVTALHMAAEDGAVLIASGSRDGSIRLWAYRDPAFVVTQSLIGHAREVTGLVLLPAHQLLWSCGMDQCIRVWNTVTGDCQYCITPPEKNRPPAVAGGGGGGNIALDNAAGPVGHTEAVTALLAFQASPGHSFILSSSLDRYVKVWNAVTGECVASELHNEGVVCMALAKDVAGNELLLLGMESGSIQCRNLQPYPNIAAFRLLFTLSSHYTGVGHDGAVKCLAAGPSATFYTGGTDGKMLVFSFCGDLGLNG